MFECPSFFVQASSEQLLVRQQVGYSKQTVLLFVILVALGFTEVIVILQFAVEWNAQLILLTRWWLLSF